MAMQAYEPQSHHHHPHDEEDATGSANYASASCGSMHSNDLLPQVEANIVLQGSSNDYDTNALNASTVNSNEAGLLRDDDPVNYVMQPALKKLRCWRDLQNRQRPPSLDVSSSHQYQTNSDDDKLHIGKDLNSGSSMSVTEINYGRNTTSCMCVTEIDDPDRRTIHINRNQNSTLLCNVELDEEAADSECTTPTAREQRIPEPKDLVCPPPPMKRKPPAFKKKNATLSNAYNRANLLITPPDLHTYPECIRALFDK